MRKLFLATIVLASSSLSAFAQNEGKPPISPAQSAPTEATPTDPKAQQRDQRSEEGQSKGGDREMDRDWRMRQRDGDRTGPNDRGSPDMQREYRDEYRDHDKDRSRFRDRERQGWDHAERDLGYRSHDDDERPRRRVKICVEYDNGDEYCRYRQSH